MSTFSEHRKNIQEGTQVKSENDNGAKKRIGLFKEK